MADRTAAEIFAKVFDVLARNPTDDRLAIAREIAPMARQYDFHPCQMNCDDALVSLGLAAEGPDSEDPDENCVVYLLDDWDRA
jgi:hypothetical protein